MPPLDFSAHRHSLVVVVVLVDGERVAAEGRARRRVVDYPVLVYRTASRFDGRLVVLVTEECAFEIHREVDAGDLSAAVERGLRLEDNLPPFSGRTQK